MQFNASDVYSYYRPSLCELRVFLATRNTTREPLSPYVEVLRNLGIRHEQMHLATFPEIVDLSQLEVDKRESQTQAAIASAAPVIYQPLFKCRMTLAGREVEVIGQPDFLIRSGEGYKIRDSKITRRITETDHPEILLQMSIYGLLYEQTQGRLPAGLEVHNGLGEIVTVPYERLDCLRVIEEICLLRNSEVEPISPVGWTKCNGCAYKDRCWERASRLSDVALIPDVDQSLATVLTESGAASIPKLLEQFTEETLYEVERPWGNKKQRVGKRAESILRSAKALTSGEEILLRDPEIPQHRNYAVFDLEGLPPHLDELEKIYLWGLQVFGDRPGEYLAATAGFGPDGDREGWYRFLDIAERVFEGYGDIPLLHWNHYERGRLKLYIERYGDPKGVANRVKQNLLDLLPITKNSVVLPLPSYSLKVVEGYVGFQRTQQEYGGDWAMAKYIEATETENDQDRASLMDDILTYNREDLEATWAVFEWLRKKSRPLEPCALVMSNIR